MLRWAPRPPLSPAHHPCSPGSYVQVGAGQGLEAQCFQLACCLREAELTEKREERLVPHGQTGSPSLGTLSPEIIIQMNT